MYVKGYGKVTFTRARHSETTKISPGHECIASVIKTFLLGNPKRIIAVIFVGLKSILNKKYCNLSFAKLSLISGAVLFY